MIYEEPPMIIVFAAFILAIGLITSCNTGDHGRYRLFHEIAEATNELKLTHTCDDFGFITARAEPNCVEKEGFRYFYNGTTITFFRMDADSVPQIVWSASLNPYAMQVRASLKVLRMIHSAFSESEQRIE